jgi:hypothetical protein
MRSVGEDVVSALPAPQQHHWSEVKATKAKSIQDLVLSTQYTSPSSFNTQTQDKLDDAPCFFERYSSFLSKNSASDLLMAISQFLELVPDSVDFTVKRSQYKVGACRRALTVLLCWLSCV